MVDKTQMQSSVAPGLLYRNAPAALEWLCRVFGFEKHAVYPGENNTIQHAELTLGSGMIMLGSAGISSHNRYMKQPDDIGRASTVGVNLVVPDADAVYKRVKAEGGEILFDIEDKPYGGRAFTCRDLEGHMWHVGTYDPWQPK